VAATLIPLNYVQDQNASNAHSRNNDYGVQILLEHCPAGWYAFQMKGASGSGGRDAPPIREGDAWSEVSTER